MVPGRLLGNPRLCFASQAFYSYPFQPRSILWILCHGFDSIFSRQSRGGFISRYFDSLPLSFWQAGVCREPCLKATRMLLNAVIMASADVVMPPSMAAAPNRLHSEQVFVAPCLTDPERHPEHFFLPALRFPMQTAAWLAALI